MLSWFMGLDRDPIAYFRRAMRGQDKEALDSLLERAKKHEDVVILGADRMEILFLSVLLEHEKEFLELRERVREKDLGRGSTQP